MKIRTITPIFRGGPDPQRADTSRPLRAPSIRGALRFWWRALSPLVEVEALREAEAALFGGVFGSDEGDSEAARASRVRVGVCGPTSEAIGPPSGTKYVTWVLRPEDNKKVFHNKVEGTLRVELSGPADAGLWRALEAWLLLGGLGGRTRRGFGAVEGPEPLPSKEALLERLDALAPPPAERPWPSLGGACVVVGPGNQSAHSAWTTALKELQRVRGRGTKLPDRSTWRAHDYQRFERGRRFSSPRAALGLPIPFQAWGDKGLSGSLIPKGGHRVPSPLLLRPIKLGDKYHPLFLVLKAPPIGAVEIPWGGGTVSGTSDPRGIRWFLEALAWPCHPLGGP